MALEITRSEAEGILSWIPRLTYNEKNAETAENYYFKYLKRIFRSMAGILLTKNRKYHKTVLKGRIEGFNKYK